VDKAEAVRDYLAGIGRRGGWSRSRRKLAAVAKDLAKARARRWTGEKERGPVMTTGASPMCMSCKRYNWETGGCEAYPAGIPTEIIMNGWDHRLPRPGDHGLQFAPKSDQVQPQEWWPDDRRGAS
jgi:hypothetical protein